MLQDNHDIGNAEGYCNRCGHALGISGDCAICMLNALDIGFNFQPKTLECVSCLHIYRDGLHDKIQAGDRISGIGLVTITKDYAAALDYLRHASNTIVSQNTDGKWRLVGVQTEEGQHATYAVEECEVWGAG